MKRKYIRQFAVVIMLFISQMILFQGQTWAIRDQEPIQPDPPTPIVEPDPPPKPVRQYVAPVYTADDYASWGDNAYNSGNFGNAFNQYYKAAEMGHARARYQLATMYEEGLGTAKDLKKAALYYKLATDDGYAKAWLKLGICQLNGWGVPVQLEKATESFLKAVDGGVSEAEGYLREIEARLASNKKEAEKKAMRSLVKAIKPEMVSVTGGIFTMGDTFGDGDSDEKPTHQVSVNSFYMGKYEVTFAEYDAFCQATGRYEPSDLDFGRGQHPVINVSWYDAIAYCNWLSSQEGFGQVYSGSGDDIQCNMNANGYRLPTEAEWEYAAKGGAYSRGYKYSGSDNVDDVAWNYMNANNMPHTVGQKRSNELGLYDMSGNVWEWCWDRYGGTSVYSPWYVLRGGCWDNFYSYVRSTKRDCNPGYSDRLYGFRLARNF